MKKITLLLFIILISACCQRTDNKVSYPFKKFVFTGCNPPKHFYINLIEVGTWDEYNHIYVSKHFNDWRQLTVGDTIKFRIKSYKNDHGKHEVFANAHDDLKNYLASKHGK